MKAAKVFAPAKVNLTLHVTGRRGDGYHLIDSLVAFADLGDRLTLSEAAQTSLSVTGPMAAGVPDDGTNLVVRAAGLFDLPVAITLEKHLPAAAGIGGGTSDAAATLLALADMTGTRALPAGIDTLGADLRVCLMRRATRMRGIGEQVEPVTGLAPLHAVLANPRVALATPGVFAALSEKNNPPMPPRLPRWRGARQVIDWLATQRNDLEAPAVALAPEVGTVLEALSRLPCARLVRMSGSGATCFALFETGDQAAEAARALRAAHDAWWIAPTTLN